MHALTCFAPLRLFGRDAQPFYEVDWLSKSYERYSLVDLRRRRNKLLKIGQP